MCSASGSVRKCVGCDKVFLLFVPFDSDQQSKWQRRPTTWAAQHFPSSIPRESFPLWIFLLLLFYKLNIQREYCRDQTVFQLANGFVIRVVSRSLLCAKWANECALLFCSRRQRTPTTLRAKSKFDCVADVLRQIKTSRTIGASSTVIVCVCMSCEHNFLNHFAVFLPLSARLRQSAYGAG